MNADTYILSFDQSTSTTKALLFDKQATLVARADIPHRQLINEKGWVEHDMDEVLRNVQNVAKLVIGKAKIRAEQIVAVSISNQRETSVAWDRRTGESAYPAIVWQCGRATEICKALEDKASFVKERTGLNLSPYFSAAKFAWMLQHVSKVQELAQEKQLVFSTVDSFLIYHLTQEHAVKTEYSNASRTQLLNLQTLTWDEKICSLFGLDVSFLPTLEDSNTCFGYTTLFGLLPQAVPLCGVLGDSQGALFAQDCLSAGMVKATYGTGSSIMMNVGQQVPACKDLVTSIAWSLEGKPTFVLEGNINYAGATIQWLVEDVKLIASAKEAGQLASQAKPSPGLYLVPAFSGLGAPYWDTSARALICGMSRTTGKCELVRAAEEAIAYQISDIIRLMKKESGFEVQTLRVDGGPTNDSFLMQFQADIIQSEVRVASLEELSGQGPALLCGLALGLYDQESIFQTEPKATYLPQLSKEKQKEYYAGWQKAVEKVLAQ